MLKKYTRNENSWIGVWDLQPASGEFTGTGSGIEQWPGA